MEIREIRKEERFEAECISAFCFHMKMEDPEQERLRAEKNEDENWGAFADDGTMMAHIINNHFRFYVDGTAVEAGGIGGVSTLPQYRREGAVRAIFRELLPAAYRRGEVLSALYPFNHEFYRKQGYEVVTYGNDYTLQPQMLERYSSPCEITSRKPGEPAGEYLAVYNSFARNYNLSMPRDEKRMKEHLDGEGKPGTERRFSYLFRTPRDDREEPRDRALAYLIFTDTKQKEGRVLKVEECAWICPDGFTAILSFLGRFDADYESIELPLPAGIDLLRIIRTRRAYNIRKTTRNDYMVRIVNTEKLFAAIRIPENTDLLIRAAGDEIIPENNGIFHVTKDGAARVDHMCEAAPGTTLRPDAEFDIRVLGLLAVGACSYDEAVLMPGTIIPPETRGSDKEIMLRSLFREKPIFIREGF